MTDYDDITMARYFRVVMRQCVILHDIGFSEKAINEILEIASNEIVRLIDR